MEKIYETSDYSIFKKLEGNRSVNEKRVKEISASIDAIGWITNPIIVNSNMEVIDGQGRLEALKRKAMPVQYIILNGAGLNECREMNLHSVNWSSEDMIRSFANTGHNGCRKVQMLMDEFNVPASTVCIVIGYSRQCLKKQAREIQVSDEKYTNARNFFIWYKTVEQNVKKLPGRLDSKIDALAYCFNHGVDMNELKAVIGGVDKSKFNATTKESILKTIQDAYNFNKKSRKNRIYVYESYRKGE